MENQPRSAAGSTASSPICVGKLGRAARIQLQMHARQKEVGLKSIQTQLDKRIQLRMAYAQEKLKSVQSKLERLTQLSERMNKQDMERVAKLLQGLPSLRQDILDDDPFK